MKIFYVKSQRLAGFLMLKGFVLKGMQPNLDTPKRNVFLFNNSEQLLLAIPKYKQMKGEETNVI